MFFAGKFILDLASFAEQRGIARGAVLAASGLDEAQLNREGQLVDYTCVTQVFQVLKSGEHPDTFGLHMGEQINLMSTAFVDQLMESCSTVQEAFEHAIAYSKLISDSMICSLKVYDSHFKVNFELNPEWALKDNYAIAQNLNLALICAKNSLQRLTQAEYFPSEVNFHYPKPSKTAEYMRLFNCHLKFNQAVSSIVFNRTVLHESSVSSNFGLLEQLKSKANEIVETLPQESELLLQVKRSILNNISPESFHIIHVARELNLTPRTLQRKLKAEQLTFKQVQNDLRFQIVQKLLMDPANSLHEIAYLVGYSEPSVLVRAFKSWTGLSPKKYIKVQQAIREQA